MAVSPLSSGTAATRSTRRAGGTSCIASMALRVRFSSTCSSITPSPSTGGRPGATLIWIETKNWRACSSTSGVRPSSSCLMSIGCRAGSRLRTNACTLRMIWPARCAWALAFSSADFSMPCSAPAPGGAPAGSARRSRSWRSPPAAGSVHAPAVDASSPMLASRALACSFSCCWRLRFSARRCGPTRRGWIPSSRSGGRCASISGASNTSTGKRSPSARWKMVSKLRRDAARQHPGKPFLVFVHGFRRPVGHGRQPAHDVRAGKPTIWQNAGFT